MRVNLVLSLFLLVLFGCGTIAEAQTNEMREELVNRLNRLSRVMFNLRKVVRNKSINIDDAQRTMLSDLSEKYKSLEPLVANFLRSESWGELSEIESQMAAQEQRVRTEILTPAQNETLEKIEFDAFLDASAGDFARLLLVYYPDRMGLTSAQKEKLKQQSQRSMDSIRNAMVQQQDEFADLVDRNFKDVTKLLTKSQHALATEWLGVPFSVSGSTKVNRPLEQPTSDATIDLLIKECERLNIIFRLCKSFAIDHKQLEIVDSQQERLLESIGLAEELILEARQIAGVKERASDKCKQELVSLIGKLQKREKELYEDILVEHQARDIKARQIRYFLGKSKGLYSTVFYKHYALALDLKRNQLEELEQLSVRDLVVVDRLANGSQARIIELRKKSEEKALEIISEEQLEQLP